MLPRRSPRCLYVEQINGDGKINETYYWSASESSCVHWVTRKFPNSQELNNRLSHSVDLPGWLLAISEEMLSSCFGNESFLWLSYCTDVQLWLTYEMCQILKVVSDPFIRKWIWQLLACTFRESHIKTNLLKTAVYLDDLFRRMWSNGLIYIFNYKSMWH